MTDPSNRTEETDEEEGRKRILLLLLLLLLLVCLLTTGMGDTFRGLGDTTSSPGNDAGASKPVLATVDVAESGLPYAIGGNVSQSLRPGGPASPIAITFSSPNAGNGVNGTRVSSLTVSISSVTGGGPGPNPCTAADFALTQVPAAAYPFYVPLGESSLDSLIGAGYAPKLRMLDRADAVAGDGTGNQDACKGATVHLAIRGES